MENSVKQARIAGLLYLVVVITGIFSLMYVPNKIIVWDNATLTLQNIIKNESLFRLGIVSGLICYSAFLFLVLSLYQLLKSVHESISKLMVILALISVPMYFINAQNLLTILSFINDAIYNQLWSTNELASQVFIKLEQYNSGMSVIHIFSGLWLFPFGYLVYKSNFLPKIFGVLLMMGCFGYLINFAGHTLIKDFSYLGIGFYISLPSSLGEIGICLWMLIVGCKFNLSETF
ncbi:MAG: DUF4386 domain-containing protein [Sphingobacteriales bacterium]|nr:DUF4386 domain-containing protein [Sphingobacteriales bacterium]